MKRLLKTSLEKFSMLVQSSVLVFSCFKTLNILAGRPIVLEIIFWWFLLFRSVDRNFGYTFSKLVIIWSNHLTFQRSSQIFKLNIGRPWSLHINWPLCLSTWVFYFIVKNWNETTILFPTEIFPCPICSVFSPSDRSIFFLNSCSTFSSSNFI